MLDTSDDLRQLETLTDVGERLRSASTRQLAVISGFIEHEVGDFVGSGSFITFGRRTLLLTAEHVVRTAETHPFKGVTYLDGQKKAYIRILTQFKKSVVLDLAFAQVSLSEDSDRLACPEDLIANSCSGVESELLFFVGVPERHSRYLAIDKTIHSRTLPCLTGCAPAIWPKFDPRIHLAVSFDPVGQRYADGTEAEYLDPHGISGSALWNTNRKALGAAWSPSDARMVGVITHWDQEARCLIAVRIEAIRQFIAREIGV